jgi:hypothetical protein
MASAGRFESHRFKAMWTSLPVFVISLLISFGSESAFANEQDGLSSDGLGIEIEVPFEEPEGDWVDFETSEGDRYFSQFIASSDRAAVNEYLKAIWAYDSVPINVTFGILFCWEKVCSGRVADSGMQTFTVYALVQDYTELRRACDSDPELWGTQAYFDCANRVGCEAGEGWVSCPTKILEEGASFTIDPADYRVNELAPQAQEILDTTGAVRQEPSAGAATGLEDESVFGLLPRLGPPEEVIRRLALSVGIAIVFVVLALLPTQLINSVLEVHGRAIAARARRLLLRGKNAVADQAPRTKNRLQKTLHAVVVFFLASLMVGFVEPDFGFNVMSLRLFLTGFASFLVINFVAIVLVWLLFRKRAQVEMPHLEVHFSYLAVIAATVLVSRLLALEPVIVFGVVLVIESGRVIAQTGEQIEALNGRLAYASGLLTLALGILTYAGYHGARGALLEGSLSQVALSEFFAIVTIEALATLPVLLLPLTFLPGYHLFRWSKVRWFATFVSSLALFIFVLIPLPDSWASAGVSLALWTFVLVAYSLFAAGFWAFFAAKTRRAEAAKSAIATN